MKTMLMIYHSHLQFRILTVLVFIFLATDLQSQKTVDSLLTVAGNSSGKAKFDALKALGKYYKSTDPAKSVDFANLELKQARAMNNRSLVADALNDIAIPILMMQQNRQGVLLLQESIHIYDSLRDEEGKARVTANLGIAWSQIGSYENSLKCYRQALDWYTKNNDLQNQARIYMSLGLVYEQLKKSDQSLDAHHKALEIFSDEKDERMMADAGINLGLAYKATGNFSEAESCFRNSLNYYQQNYIVFGMAVAVNNLAQLFKAKDDFASAIVWYTKALPLIRQVHNTWAEATVYFDLADINYTQENWNEALTNLTIAEKLNASESDPTLQSQIFLLTSHVYDKLRQTRLALDFYRKYTAVRDTLFSTEKTKAVEELNIRFETEKKDAENKLLMDDLKVHKLRQWILLAISLAVFLTAIIFVSYFLKKRKLLLKKNIQTENEREEARNELAKMSQELTAKALHLAGNADKKAVFAEKLASLIPYINPHGKLLLENLVDEFSSATDENLWEEFIKYFEKMHPAFMTSLAKDFPGLSSNERKICAMVRLNLSTKEIALMLNRSVRTIESARYQAKKKLELTEDQNLTAFLMAL